MKKITVIVLVTMMFIASKSYAYSIVATGNATIKNLKLREAYYSAINNAKLASIKWYYKENKIANMDVNDDFFKFIKSYSILEQNIVDSTAVSVKLKIDLDDAALKDAKLLLNQYEDSAVYLYRGIDNTAVSTKQIQDIITNLLLAKQFSLTEQALFLRKINDIYNEQQILKAFNDIDVVSLIIFDFRTIEQFEEFQDQNDVCEIESTVTVMNKKNGNKTMQLITGNNEPNTGKCYSNAVRQATYDIVTYIRDNIIKLPETVAKLKKYDIEFINANNLVLTKNIMDTLSQRGLIKSFKTVSYSQKSVVFEVNSYFSAEELCDKIQELKLSRQPTKIELNNTKLILDFSVE